MAAITKTIAENIATVIERRISGSDLARLHSAELRRVAEQFMASGYADGKFLNELAGNEGAFWSALSEALVFDRIAAKAFGARAKIGHGPDFLLMDNGRRVWIEVVCPQPGDIPADWLACVPGFGSVPHNQILLRWTAAIKEKTEKLLGSPDGQRKGYLQKGVVDPSDCYVIAVNGCRLRHGLASALEGITQYPYAVEAALALGPYSYSVDLQSNKIVREGYSERYLIPKSNASTVPASTFLDPRNSMVSAIWAVDFNGTRARFSTEPSAVIHNPLAKNPVPVGFLSSDIEYVSEVEGDFIVLTRRPGTSPRGMP